MDEARNHRFTNIQAALTAVQNQLGREENRLAKPRTFLLDTAVVDLFQKLLPDQKDQTDFVTWHFEREKGKHQAAVPVKVQSSNVYFDTIIGTDFTSTESTNRLFWCLNASAHPYIGIGVYREHVYRLSPSTALLHLEASSVAEETRLLEHVLELGIVLDTEKNKAFSVAQLGRVEFVPEPYFKSMLAGGKCEADMDWQDSGYVLATRVDGENCSEVWLLYDLNPVDFISGEACSIDESDVSAFYLPGDQTRRTALKIADSMDELKGGGEWKIGVWTEKLYKLVPRAEV
jgi:hypothetical protein